MKIDAESLKAAQAPLKQRYRDDPAAAKWTLSAEGRVGFDRLTTQIETGKGRVEAGLHPATGGSGDDACSGDMLLEALAGCAGVTLGAVATALGIAIRSAKVRVEGDLDFRGTLGVAKEAAVGFSAIRVHFDLDTEATEAERASLFRLVERYCVVFQTLSHPPAIALSHSVGS